MKNSENILVYVRPWNVKQFNHLAYEIWPNNNQLHLSEHKHIDKVGFSSLFYKNLSKKDLEDPIVFFEKNDIVDIIKRCRLLRSLPYSTAKRYLTSAHLSIKEIVQKYNPSAAISVTTDSYIIHLLYLNCRKYNIPFIGLVPSFVNDHFRITALGERNRVRDVSIEEAEGTINILLEKNYKPSFVTSEKKIQIKAYKNWIKNLVKPLWFQVLRIVYNDIHNYHYKTTQIISQRYWSLLPAAYKGFGLTDLEEMKNKLQKKIIYIPLQMSPEATIDYWSYDTSWIDYEDRILQILKDEKLSELYFFVVKEHPNILGYRRPSFYKKLSSQENCMLISVNVSSNELLDFCDSTIICTGTVGFEAHLRGVPVFSDSNPWHLRIDDVNNIASLYKNEISKQFQDERSLLESSKYLLESLCHGNFINNGSWSETNPRHLESNEVVARSIRKYLSLLNL